MSSDKVSAKPQVVIVGGKGRMGQMLCTKAQAQGFPIASLDRPLTQDRIAPTVATCDLLFFSVPALAFERVVATVCPLLPKTCIVSDITSVKEMPLRVMEHYWSGCVIGTHPLFGPKPDPKGPLPVALVPGHGASETTLAITADFFTALGCTVFRCTAEDHDHAMSLIQNLNFITNLAYFALLANHEELLPFLTPSFKRRLTAAQKMLTEDAAMFSGLFESNAKSHDAVRQFRHILNIAASGDIEILCKKVQWWWKDTNTRDPS